jgi:GH25 family lysozyme M1 (1,4-beta-N-acetylmuramidase)
MFRLSLRPTRAPRRLLAAGVLAALLVPTLSAGAEVLGPDVSSYQHPTGPNDISWSTTKVSGASFAFVKATEGTTYTNPYFAADFAAIKKAGLIRGAYHFARPTSSTTTAVAQAAKFVKVAGRMGLAGDLPPVLDLEVNNNVSPAALIRWTGAYLSEIKRLTGRDAIIYTGPYFWKTKMANSTAFTNHPLWAASYTTSKTLTLFGGWGFYTFWQYTSSATMRGLPGKVDMSRFNGTLDRLNVLAKRAPAPAPTPAPAPGSVTKPPIPGPPSALKATQSSAVITLTWTAPKNTPVTAYMVRIDATPWRTLKPSTRYVLPGLAMGKVHQVSLAARNATGSSRAASLQFTAKALTRLDVATVAVPKVGVRLNITVRRTDQTRGLAAAPLTIQVRPRRGPVPSPLKVISDSAGRRTFQMRPQVTTDIQISYPGTTMLMPSTRTVVITAARPVLTARLSAAQIPRGATATLSGATSTFLAGVTVYRQGFYDGGWHTWATTAVRSGGTYSFTIRPTSTPNSYRVWLPGTRAYASAASSTVTLRTK